MEALTGCTRDELIAAPFKNYFTDPERAEAAIKLVLREKKVTDYELTACARDGTTTDVSYNATTFYDRERTLQGVFAAARDVTDRKRNEQALQKTNVELESAKSAAVRANLAKSDFLSSMSHELRTPLNAILGFAQLMDSDSPPPTPFQKASIDEILHAGWYLLELINEILDLAVIAGRGHVRMPDDDRTAGAKAWYQTDLFPVRHPSLCPRRSDPVEAGAHQPPFQCHQIQSAGGDGRRGLQ
jgi:PAS domain S-box-containing protein